MRKAYPVKSEFRVTMSFSNIGITKKRPQKALKMAGSAQAMWPF